MKTITRQINRLIPIISITINPLTWYIRSHQYWGRINGEHNESKCEERYKHTKFLCFTITTWK